MSQKPSKFEEWKQTVMDEGEDWYNALKKLLDNFKGWELQMPGKKQEMISPAGAEASSPQPTPTSMPMPTPTPTMPPMVKGNIQRTPESDAFLADRILPITNEYGLPQSLVGGQFGGEGRLGGQNAPINNYFNVGAYDERGGKGFSYPSVEEGVKAYAELLTQDPRYSEAWTQYQKDQDISKLLMMIAPTYASNPDYTSLIQGTPEWRQYLPQ